MMAKPICPRCHSTSWRPRVRTQDCRCLSCGQIMPHPWDSPKEYEELVESMKPRADELIAEALAWDSNADYKEVIKQVESMNPPPNKFLLDLLKNREEAPRKCVEENINHD